jgi:hypothetical protein
MFSFIPLAGLAEYTVGILMQCLRVQSRIILVEKEQ